MNNIKENIMLFIEIMISLWVMMNFHEIDKNEWKFDNEKSLNELLNSNEWFEIIINNDNAEEKYENKLKHFSIKIKNDKYEFSKLKLFEYEINSWKYIINREIDEEFQIIKFNDFKEIIEFLKSINYFDNEQLEMLNKKLLSK